MSLAIIHSRASRGVVAPLVTVEVHLSRGLPGFSIVGLPEAAVKESRHRVRSAIINSQLEFPTRRITVNLGPADLPKEGGRFDLAIALGILVASKQLSSEHVAHYEFAGELALTGQLRPIKGALPFAIATGQANRHLMIARENVDEATLMDKVAVFGASHLLEVCSHLRGVERLPPSVVPACVLPCAQDYPDLADVKGQKHGKRALEIAAAGGHSLLLMGPPGAGKTMLVRRLPGILPPMNTDSALETAAVYSMGHSGFDARCWRIRPFRAPHHTASSVALVGGGSPPRPGEISLAHGGVLFLDELPEFSRSVLESLREPLEAGTITISRASRQAEFPAAFQLVAAMNPCPCGYQGDRDRHCTCTSEQVRRYQSRLSGPLLDRIDMHVEIPALPVCFLTKPGIESVDSSERVRQRVMMARAIQHQRAEKVNAWLAGNELLQHCGLGTSAQNFLEKAMTQLGLSARAYYRVLKLARTIADLDRKESIGRHHVEESLSYRRLERCKL